MLPEVVADLLQLNDQRRRVRHAVWSQHRAAAHARSAGYDRMAAAEHDRDAVIDLDASGLER